MSLTLHGGTVIDGTGRDPATCDVAIDSDQFAVQAVPGVTNAAILGIADRLGSIEPGKIADLIGADFDPLTGRQAHRQVTARLNLLTDFPPAASAIAGCHGLQHGNQGSPVDVVPLVDLDGLRRRVAVALVDDAVRVRNVRVVHEQVDVVLGREQGTHVPVEDEVRLN
jgi:hypothetical protein